MDSGRTVSQRCLAIVWIVALIYVMRLPETSADESASEVSAQRLYDRYLSILKRSPKPGTTFDRVFQHHIDRGTLDQFINSLQQDSSSNESGNSLIVLGMVQDRLGNAADAVLAYVAATQRNPKDPILRMSLGKAQLTMGNLGQASAELEASLSLDLPRLYQEDVYRCLGRVYQRQNDTSKSLELWNRFESAFPNDLRVQEQIAQAQRDDGLFAEAFIRYRQLAERASDPYQRIQYSMKATELQIELGQETEAVQKLETLLDDVKSSSWISGELRSRIEDVFLRTDDFKGLIEYYRDWLSGHPDDLTAMTRIARFEASNGNFEAAVDWYRQAIVRAPANRSIRLSLIDLLATNDVVSQAIVECERLYKLDPTDEDLIARWGKLALEERDVTEEERRRKAVSIWKLMLDDRSSDGLATSRVAELLREAGFESEALMYHRLAIEQDPSNVEYHESLGTCLHSLNRREQAVEAWERMATGPLRIRENLLQLYNVYEKFGYRGRALEVLQDVRELGPEVADLVQLSKVLAQQREFGEALACLDQASKLADSTAQRQTVLTERIKLLESAGRIDEEAQRLHRVLNDRSTSDEWLLLAALRESQGSYSEAVSAAQSAIGIAPDSSGAWVAAAGIQEKAGLLKEAADSNRHVAEIDRRLRTRHLRRVVELERRLGRIDRSLTAAEDLIAAAPGKSDSYQFAADLCFELRRNEQGLSILRRGMRSSPKDVSIMKALAAALARQYRTAEAIEILWRALKTTDDRAVAKSIVETISELSLRTGDFENVIERLRRTASPDATSALILQAAACRAADDLAQARTILKQALAHSENDPGILKELVSLAEADRDLSEAIQLQSRLTEFSNTAENKSKLTSLIIRTGPNAGDNPVFASFAERDLPSELFIQQIDAANARKDFVVAEELCRRLLKKNPKDWEVLFRLAVLRHRSNDLDEANRICEKVISLPIARSTPAHGQAGSNDRNGAAVFATFDTDRSSASVVKRIEHLMSTARRASQDAAGVDNLPVRTFNDCVWAALQLRLRIARQQQAETAFLNEMRLRCIQETGTPFRIWDWWHVNRIARLQPGEDETLLLDFEHFLGSQTEPEFRLAYLISMEAWRESSENGMALTPHQIDLILQSARIVNRIYEDWSRGSGGANFVVAEVKLAEQSDRLDQFVTELSEVDSTLADLELAATFAARTADTERILSTFRLLTLAYVKADARPASSSNVYQAGMLWGEAAARLSAGGKNLNPVFELLSGYLELRSTFPNTRDTRSEVTSSGHVDLFVRRHFRIFTNRNLQEHRQVAVIQAGHQLSDADHTFLVNVVDLVDSKEAHRLFDTLDRFKQETDSQSRFIAEIIGAEVAYLNGDAESSIRCLIRAAAASPDNTSLRLGLAHYYEGLGNHVDALALVETIEAKDRQTLRQREELAMDLAEHVGNSDRMKVAAERLFGLQLDPSAAVSLSNRMQAMGLDQMAAALLARTRKSSGNDLASRLALMDEYQSAGRSDISSQIAIEILQRTDGDSVSWTSEVTPDEARHRAVTLLGRIDRLQPLIERTKRQLHQAPESKRLLERLASYYIASGEDALAESLQRRLEALRPRTIDSILKLADEFERRNEPDRAADAYLEVFRKDPLRFAGEYFRHLRVFQQADRLDDLADVLLEKSTLTRLQNHHHVVMETVQFLFSAATDRHASVDRQKAVSLFQAAWQQYPNYRRSMVSNIREAAMWELPEMFEYARSGLIPTTLQQSIARPWQGLADTLTFDSNHQITGAITRIRDGLQRDPKLRTNYIKEVEEAVRRFHRWHGGKALLAVLYSDVNQHDRAAELLKNLANDDNVFHVPVNVAWLLCVEFEKDGNARLMSEAVPLLETAMSHAKPGHSDVRRSPTLWLARYYAGLSRDPEAVSMLMKALSGGSSGSDEIESAEAAMAVADAFRQIGFPFHALQVYQGITERTFADPSPEKLRKLIETAESLSASMWKTSTPVHAMRYLSASMDDPHRSVDLQLYVQQSQDGRFRLQSRILSALLRNEGTRLPSAWGKRFFSQIRRLPNVSLEIAVVATVAGDVAGMTDLQEFGASRLKQHLERSPQETSLPGSEICVWLASRSVGSMPGEAGLTQNLMEHALTASRSAAIDFRMAVLDEAAERALAAGDLKTAESSWQSELDLLLKESAAEPNGVDEADVDDTPAALRELRTLLLNAAE